MDLPRKTVVVGAGYIAVELAGILNALGSDVSLLIRYDQVGKKVLMYEYNQRSEPLGMHHI